MLAAAQAAFKALPQALQAINGQALGVGLLALACCYLTPKGISRIVPGSLLGLIIGTLTAVYAQLGDASQPCNAHKWSGLKLSCRLASSHQHAWVVAQRMTLLCSWSACPSQSNDEPVQIAYSVAVVRRKVRSIMHDISNGTGIADGPEGKLSCFLGLAGTNK